MATCSGKVLSAHIAPKFLPHLEILLQVIKTENEQLLQTYIAKVSAEIAIVIV